MLRCFPIHFLCNSQLYQKKMLCRSERGKKLLFLQENLARMTLDPARMNSCFLASIKVLPSFAVRTWYESHVLSLGFVKWLS